MKSRRSFLGTVAGVVAGLIGLSRTGRAEERDDNARITVSVTGPDGITRVLEEYDTTDPNTSDVVTRSG